MTKKIGLEGVFKTEAFAAGLKTYTGGLSKAIGVTTSVAGSIGSALGGAVMVGVAAFAALGAAAIAAASIVAGAITKMIFDAATVADKFAQLSAQTGISTTRLQELAYAGTMLDVDLETITSGLRFLTRNMYAARDGTGEQADAFKALGIKVLDARGNLRDANVVFGEAIDALGGMENLTEADAIAMKLMGRSAMELNPLIRAGSKALAEYSLEAHDMGAIISEEGILALDLFKDRFDALKLSAKGIMASFALAFLPAFQEVEGYVRDFVRDLSKVKNLKGLLTVGKKWMRSLSLGMIKSSADFKKSIPKIIKKITDFLVAGLPEFITFASTLIATIIKGISAALPTLIPAAAKILTTIIKSLKDNWPMIMQAGKDLLAALGEGIAAGWEILKPNLPTISEILDWMFKTGVDLSAKFLAWVKKIDWTKLSQDIATALSQIDWSKYGAEFRTMVNNLGAAIKTIIEETDWGALGKSVSKGFADFVVGFTVPGENWQTGVVEPWRRNYDLLAQMTRDYGWQAIGEEIIKEIAQGLRTPEGMQDLYNGLTLKETFAQASAGWQTFFDGLNLWWTTSWTVFFVESLMGWKKFFDDLNLWWTTTWTAFCVTARQWGRDLVTAIQTGITDAWGAFVTLVNGLVNILVRTIMNALNPLLNLFGIGAPIIQSSLMLSPVTAAPTVPIPNVTGVTTGGGGFRRKGEGGNLTQTVYVYNPSPEPASTSVSRELKKLSYLGVPA